MLDTSTCIELTPADLDRRIEDLLKTVSLLQQEIKGKVQPDDRRKLGYYRDKVDEHLNHVQTELVEIKQYIHFLLHPHKVRL